MVAREAQMQKPTSKIKIHKYFSSNQITTKKQFAYTNIQVYPSM